MSVLDADELLHLGLHATNNNDPEKALEYLKSCLELEPQRADAMYLLGATYAQLGMYDRAAETLAQTIALNPRQHTAVFQLGLLQLTRGDVEAARRTWSALDELGGDHYLYLFKSAMLALVADDFSECIALIERGIGLNAVNEALNNDMRRVRESAETARAGETAATDNAAVGHLVLSGYQQASEKKH